MITEAKMIGGMVKFEKVNVDMVKVYFETEYPAKYYRKDLKEVVKASQPFKGEVIAPLSQLVDLYLQMRTFDDSFKDKVKFINDNTSIYFYKVDDKPMELVIMGIDYDKDMAGVYYLSVLNYPYLLFLAYFKTFLQQFSVLQFHEGGVTFSYNREEKLLTIMDRELDKFHYLEVDEINIMQELLSMYFERNVLFDHYFTPDRNVGIDRTERFLVNDKEFPFSVFRKVVYLTQV